MLRRLCLLLVGLLAAGVVTAAPAFAAAPTITSVSPTTGGLDTLFTVTGTGFTAASKVRIGDVLATSVKVVSAVKITARVPVTGSGPVTVTTADGTATGPTFTVTSGMLVAPAVLRPSATTAVTATGFAATEAVDVYLDSTAVGLVVTTSGGTVTTSVTTAPTTSPGTHWVTAVGRRSGVATQSAVTVRTDWNSPNFDAGHTGVNPFEAQVTTSTVGNLVQRWSTYYGRQAYAPPVVAAGLVLFHTYNDEVVAVDAATGVQSWLVDLSSGTTAFSALTVAGGLVYAGATDGYLYALTLTTGVQKWRYSTGTASISDNPVVSGNTVYVPSRNGALYALNATTGTLRWGTSVGGSNNFYSPTVVGTWLYVGASDNSVRRIDTVTGGNGWVASLDGTPFSAPVVADGRVFAGLLSGAVYALRASNGLVDWSASTGAGSVTGTPALVGGRLIVSNTGSVVTAYDYTSGEVLWSQTGGKGGYSQVTSAGGVAYVSNSVRTTAYDVVTGAVLRRIALGANSGGTVIADGALYGFDYGDVQLTRFDLAPDRDAARPAPPSLSPRS